MNDEAALPSISELYNRHYQRNQASRVASLHAELLREIREAHQRGVPTTLAWPVPRESPLIYRERFTLITGDGHYRSDAFVLGPSTAGVRTSDPRSRACVRIDKDTAQELLRDIEEGQHWMAAAFFDGVLVLPTDLHERNTTCAGGISHALAPGGPDFDWFYTHDERSELCHLVRQVANSSGMSPTEYQRWLQQETGNDPGSQIASP